jgi:hypothetical protein
MYTGTLKSGVFSVPTSEDSKSIHLPVESCTPGTRQYKMVCTGTSQYVPYSIQGRTRNLKMVHTSTYQYRKFLCSTYWYVLVCTALYLHSTRWYKMVQGGTRWYKVVQTMVYGGTWRYKAVRESFISYRLVRSGMYYGTDPYDSIWVCCLAAGFTAAILPC